ncbi:pyridoxamine 5'-phosphate oxidase family protein [Bacillus shivajii]|uniref:pyridoxamine 5'-phosphate oxidase family protein n=1 Tax=Bacillus shivajii TaxID=1983719 RepID=UPI001CFABB48|nr:pyridoxamine 5'-phosphate oxidase family protein [Bacillus shivajii]UCZ52755.1 pyridoxamine 5'-phosphate oxidase family protein [Bacillus shivajii]
MKVKDHLSTELVEFLRGETLVSLITIDEESKKPTVACISWLKALAGGKTIKFAIGDNAESVKNILANPYVVLNVIGPDSCYQITGTGEVSETFKETIKFKVVTVNVEEVEDVIFYGAKITTPPAYEKTYDPNLAKKIDREIYEKLTD